MALIQLEYQQQALFFNIILMFYRFELRYPCILEIYLIELIVFFLFIRPFSLVRLISLPQCLIFHSYMILQTVLRRQGWKINQHLFSIASTQSYSILTT